MNLLKKVNIVGFKSIENAEVTLGDVNVLIGANGAGKSNFCKMFDMQSAIAKGMLQNFILKNGRREDFFFKGPKKTPSVYFGYDFSEFKYDIHLTCGPEKTFIELEKAAYQQNTFQCTISSNCVESLLGNFKGGDLPWQQNYDGDRQDCGKLLYELYHTFLNWRCFHFRDTSPLAAMRGEQALHDNGFLRKDGSNLASYIKKLSPDKYKQLLNVVRLVYPKFDDFVLKEETQGRDDLVRLQWMQKGSDYIFQPHQLSDGTLSFICIAAALIGETNSSLMIFDEPELGLHPAALTFMSSLMKSIADRTQIIITTQSPALLDYFEPENVIVVEQNELGVSEFKRLDCKRLESWLEDYSLSELWSKNELGGRPNA